MPDTHNCKNFFAHGGNELVIGGKLTILEGATVEGLAGAMDKLENIPESTATTVAALKESFNTLLAALKNAGLMEADVPEEDEDDDEENGDDDNGGSGGDEDPGGDA